MSLRFTCTILIVSVIFLKSCKDNGQVKNESESENFEKKENTTNEVLLSSEIVWEKLNPARGEQSPQAGTLWGDRKGTVATGFLAKFVDGFSSPPHIHNVTYRAVVIKGLVHNDDPKASTMWMKSGSFWTQPQGEVHITSAKGDENIALVEIDKGPYLVKPIEEAFDNGERAINIDASNIIWLNNEKTHWISANCKAEISFLWNNGISNGLFVKFPQGFSGKIESKGTVFHSVVIQGYLNYTLPKDQNATVLDSGSHFSSKDEAVHTISNLNSEVLLYIRTNGSLKIY